MTSTAANSNAASRADGHATLFNGAADAYVRFRPPYPDQVFTYLIEELRLTSSSRVTDLGCGPGTLAIPLSNHVGAVVAVDPNEGMLDLGRAAAAGEPTSPGSRAVPSRSRTSLPARSTTRPSAAVWAGLAWEASGVFAVLAIRIGPDGDGRPLAQVSDALAAASWGACRDLPGHRHSRGTGTTPMV